MRWVTILGSTGSIGQSTVDLISRAPEGQFAVRALTGGRNVALLAEQARVLRPELAVIADESALGALEDALAGTGIKTAAGRDAVIQAAAQPADWIMSAIVGFAGLEPGLTALAQGTTLALANKETLVTAGPLVMAEAARHGATLLPVDSEHSAIFQALVGEDISAVERVVITASGGAFRDWPVEDLPRATLAQASAHPNWDMGQRITIDSASMFNKALELIETKEFFGIVPDKIETVIHRESLVHALVGFQDGALMAHLGAPDMRHAIGYALNWPSRVALPVDRLDLAKIGQLSFAAPDPQRYPALALARGVMETGGLAGAAFNAAKERALDHFIAEKIRFTDMAPIVERVLDRMAGQTHLSQTGPTLDEIDIVDQLARAEADAWVHQTMSA